jgi:hypothetical protein
MPFLLRSINRRRWDKVAWLEEGRAQANALWDLRTEENKLSFWHVKDDKSNLYQVAAAIAAGRDAPDKFDYALFDQSLLEKISVRLVRTSGRSFHKEADKYWHRDTTELSAQNVAEIANMIMEYGTKDRIWPTDIVKLVKEAVSSGVIDVTPLKDRLKQKGLDNWLE